MCRASDERNALQPREDPQQHHGGEKGNPNPKFISTSYVERQNLTMRMGVRRYTRLTNAFSKNVENQDGRGRSDFTHYNFCGVHQTFASPCDGSRDRLARVEPRGVGVPAGRPRQKAA